MISRSDYVGPLTKSAQAMFDRAERHARRIAARAAPKTARPSRQGSPIEAVINALGLTITVLRHWEDVGLIAFERKNGRRVIDEDGLERLRTVALLRRAGFSIKQIAWLSDTLPPSLETLRRALRDRQDYPDLERTGLIYRAKTAPRPKAAVSMGSRP